MFSSLNSTLVSRTDFPATATWCRDGSSVIAPIDNFFSSATFAFAAPQDRVDPQDQLARAERFRDVIVRAELQADDAIDFLRLRRQHDDRNVPRGHVGLQDLADFEPRHLRQHQVENDERGRFFPRLAESGRAVGGGAQGKAGLPQMQREQIDHVLLVLDDQDSYARHGSALRQRPAGESCRLARRLSKNVTQL